MFKIFLVGLILVLYFTVGIVASAILLIIGLFSKDLRDRIAYSNVKWTFKLILFISGAEVTVRGIENLPKDEAVLYVGNHRSFFDIVLGYSVIPPKCGFVAKKELKKVFPLAVWMYFMNCWFLDRGSIEAAIKMINGSVERIKNGISMFIFPEGTRGKNDDAMLDFKEGSFKIAKKAKCKVVPIAFNNTSALFEDQFPRIKKAKVCIEIGKPIDIEALDKEEKKNLASYTQKIVKEMVENNKKYCE